MILYVDTSAVVKTVLMERDSERVREWIGQADEVVSSVITYAEACAALGLAHGRGGHVALRHGLRGMDAVQLAAALVLRTAAERQAPGADVVFAAFDRRLLEAAEREGFATLGGSLP
jgi:uncharacterized protein with PIN domain